MPVTQLDASITQLIPITGPPKVVQTITSEGQLSVGAWNAVIEQLEQAQAEKKQMRQLVKKYVSFNKQNNQYQKQNAKRQKLTPQTKVDNDKCSTVNMVEVHNEPDDDEDLAYSLWNLQMDNNETTESHYDTDECNCDNEGPEPQINVILSGYGMASEFSIEIDSYATKCHYDSGARHSCMSYRYFKSAFSTEVPKWLMVLLSRMYQKRICNPWECINQPLNLAKGASYMHLLFVKNLPMQ